MNTVQTWQIESTTVDSTLQLAGKVGAKLRGGELIELVSDLGGGKTSFVRGLAHGMGSQDQVSSPTFTISNQYQAGPLTLYHFDFYRLGVAGIMDQELQEVLADPMAVTVIEWADIVENSLPTKRLTVSLTATSENSRLLHFSYPDELAYLVEGN